VESWLSIRHGSPTFGRHVAARLTEDGGEQIFVPKGFAHGFVTLEENCEIAYKVTNYYSAEHDRGVIWNDPALRIDWGVTADEVTLSGKDLKLPRLADMPIYFRYGE
ncbi:MAG: dTDP-4-keto-6-deoxy-D-glucose epimerase, partial [Verrucomicrobiaceae bacterium]